ncbi:MAG: hypothetical protein NTV84_02030 [Methanoregula sp.]|nr:hypothetical protein [Methanoregula sp.]
MMESSGSGAANEDRIAALEKKLRDTEALVKGLTQELLDLKSIVMKMSKQADERIKKMQPLVQGSEPQAAVGGASGSGSTVVMRPKSVRQADAESEKPAEPEMGMIMQPDGTMKLEPRRGDAKYTVASAGYGRNKKGISVKPKQTDLIYAAEEEKKDPAKK